MRRSGLTLIEAIVVSAAIGLLAAVVLPEIQAAQEEERQAKCSSNLHNLAVGFHNYNDIYGFLPAGEAGHSNELFALLQPYTEMASHAAALTLEIPGWLDPDAAVGSGQEWWTADKTWELCQQPFDLFVCPSADKAGLAKATMNVAGMRYSIKDDTAILTLRYLDTSESGANAGLCTYAGSAGVTGAAAPEFAGANKSFGTHWQGMFTSEHRFVFGQILDGASRTLAIGEYLGNYDRETKAWTVSGSWAGAQTMWTAKPLAESAEKSTWSQFSSPHDGVTIFALGDAGVLPIRNTIDLKVLRAISGTHDGVEIDVAEAAK